MNYLHEIEILELFISRIDRMKQYRLSQTLLSQHTSHFTVAYNLKNPEPYWSFPQLPLDERDAFALSLRLFLQNTDEISIGNISNLINSLHLPPQFKTIWNQHRQNFNSYLDLSPERLTGVDTRRQLLDAILYGDLAHVSKKYRKQIQIWNTDPDTGPSAWAEFFSCLREILYFLMHMQKGAEKAIEILRSKE